MPTLTGPDAPSTSDGPGPTGIADGAPVGAGTWSAQLSFTGSLGRPMIYYLFSPASAAAGRRFPLAVWLHGGITGNGVGAPNVPNDIFVKPAQQATWPAFVLRPASYKGTNWVSPASANTSSRKLPPAPADSMKTVLELTDAVIAQHPIDAKQVHLFGASMGGYGTWDAILRHPTRFASAIAICGAGDPSMAATIKDMKIWISHAVDDGIVSVKGSRDMFAALMTARKETPTMITDDARKLERASADGRIRYVEYKSGGHDTWTPTLLDPRTFDFVTK